MSNLEKYIEKEAWVQDREKDKLTDRLVRMISWKNIFRERVRKRMEGQTYRQAYEEDGRQTERQAYEQE